MERRQEILALINRTLAVFLGLWLGYFLTHYAGGGSPEQLVFLSIAVIVGYGGIIAATTLLHSWPIAAASAIASILAAVASAVASSHPLPIFPVVLLVACTWIQSRQSTPLLHLLTSLVLGYAAVSAGLISGSPSGISFAYAAVFAAYFALADLASKDLQKMEFQAVFFLLLVDLIATAILGITHPFGGWAALLLGWLVIRCGWYGWSAIRNYAPETRATFSGATLAAVGLMVAAILIFQYKKDEPVGNVHLTWPVVSAALSIMMIRFAAGSLRIVTREGEQT